MRANLTAVPSILERLSPWFGGTSWDTWRIVDKAVFTPESAWSAEELAVFTELTGRLVPPAAPVSELLVIAGRRSAKTMRAAGYAVALALQNWREVLKRGEVGVVQLVAADRAQATICFKYIKAMLDTIARVSGQRERLIRRETRDQLELTHSVAIEVATASQRTVRGRTCIAVINDETAHWLDTETAANPAAEIIAAERPALATTGGPLISITTPHARSGWTFEQFTKHWGKPQSRVLVVQGATRRFNPLLDPAVIEQALEEDEPRARAEWLAEFRTDVERFIALETVEACMPAGRGVLPAVAGVTYAGFGDPSGGSVDAMTLGVGHRGPDGRIIVDRVEEVKAPFNPGEVVAGFAAILWTYRISAIEGDRYGGEWPAAEFRKHGITYTPCGQPKSQIYLNTLPLLNARLVELPDLSRLKGQLMALERRAGRGKESVDHPLHGHDDVVNAALGVVWLVAQGARQEPVRLWGGSPIADEECLCSPMFGADPDCPQHGVTA